MNRQDLRTLLEDVQAQRLTPEQAHGRLLQFLRQAPFEDIGFARVDHHRSLRQGFPEVVFGPGKTPEQIAAIAERIVSAGHSLLITRTDARAFDTVRQKVPDATFHELARTITRAGNAPPGKGIVVVAAAGTADLPVAEEAAITAEMMGNQVDRMYDVGVAGLHRLLSEHHRLISARVIIVVAGMPLSIEEKYDEVRQLISIGKEKGYLLYDEVNELLPADITSSDELDDLFSTFGSAGIEVVDSEKTYREDKLLDRTGEGAEEMELDLTPGALDKTNDPVRMYLREMGTVPLLTREGEVEIAKRIERGKLAVIKSISRTPTVARAIMSSARSWPCSCVSQ